MLAFKRKTIVGSTLSFCTLVILLTACVERTHKRPSLEGLAARGGMSMVRLNEGRFDLVGLLRVRGEASILRIYIEGDGRAFATRNRPSRDPTPEKPVAYFLAVADPSAAVAYLARPCQYGFIEHCRQRDWTTGRYGEAVIESIDKAVSALKQASGVERLELAGFSGGAAIATLVAARRVDVTGLITIAGNLDHVEWASRHGVTPLKHSLNAADVACLLRDIPRVHFVGAEDTVIPIDIVNAFEEKACDEAGRISVVPGVNHFNGWREKWRSLLQTHDLN